MLEFGFKLNVYFGFEYFIKYIHTPAHNNIYILFHDAWSMLKIFGAKQYVWRGAILLIISNIHKWIILGKVNQLCIQDIMQGIVWCFSSILHCAFTIFMANKSKEFSFISFIKTPAKNVYNLDEKKENTWGPIWNANILIRLLHGQVQWADLISNECMYVCMYDMW